MFATVLLLLELAEVFRCWPFYLRISQPYSAIGIFGGDGSGDMQDEQQGDGALGADSDHDRTLLR